MNLRKFYRWCYRFFYGRRHPIEYAKKIGVNMGGYSYLRKCKLGK